jgi:HSP20 family protein
MLYRTSITPPVMGLRREIDRLFEDAFTGNGGRAWTPVADVREDAQSLTFELELPGIDPENVEVTCDNGVLLVSGEKTGRREENEEGRYHIVERVYGQFAKSYQLPQNVNEDGIEADFESGVLTIRVPKAEQPRPRRIQVGAGQKSQRVSGGKSADASDGNSSKGKQDEKKGGVRAGAESR